MVGGRRGRGVVGQEAARIHPGELAGTGQKLEGGDNAQDRQEPQQNEQDQKKPQQNQKHEQESSTATTPRTLAIVTSRTAFLESQKAQIKVGTKATPDGKHGTKATPDNKHGTKVKLDTTES